MMSNFLIAESRRNDVIIRSFDLWTLYCRIDNFLLMLVVRRLAEREEEEFMFARFPFRRRFLEVDLEICRCHVSAWLLWLLMSRSECWLSWEDREASDLTFSLRARRWRMIWLSDYLIDNWVVRVDISDLLTNFTTCAFERDLQSDRCDCDLREKILDEERWDRVSEWQWQRRVENVRNSCESEIRRDDDKRFRWALIRNAEIRCAETREAESINERIEAIWLRRDVFVYKQRALLFEMCRFENQKNQRFDRSLVNFRSFDSDCLDSNSLRTFREFDDSFARRALNVSDCEIVVWEHDD
jgi:hypothetical protein